MSKQARTFIRAGALLAMVLVFFAIAALPAFAQVPPGTGQNPPVPPGTGQSVRIPCLICFENIEAFIFAVIPKLILLATPIVAIMVIWAAYMLLFSPANPELIKKARLTLLWTVVGYGIILVGSGLAYILREILTPPAP